jgi:cytochrome oxidase Cu insertion factor (SCO1/SenC/PrrC family)
MVVVMMRKLFIFTLLLIAMLLVFSCQQSSTNDVTSPTAHVVGNQPGNLAPDFNLQDLDGNTVSLSDFKGSPVLLSFWYVD